MDLIDKIQARRDANEMNFGDKPKSKRKNPLAMGVSHTAKIVTTRAIKDSIGNNLIGSIISLIARSVITKHNK
ncbi:MAG: hypothetical protein L3I99_05585 [Sulfurimonas sp.]|nr:hypothetical protein [Sulfurimonas sp.]